MTIGNYIKTKLSKFNFSVSNDELEDCLMGQDLASADAKDKSNTPQVLKALISLIPELLLLPEVKQGDFSIKYNVDGIKAYYALLCKQTGEPDQLNHSNDLVESRSDIW